MIQVLVSADRYPAVEEFFELFKTEWSLFNPGTTCDVLLSDGRVPPGANSQLTVVFSSSELARDPRALQVEPPGAGCRFLQFPNGCDQPVYRSLRVFRRESHVLVREKETGLAAAFLEMVSGRRMVRVGYDLFDEVAHLLSEGQPPANAQYPALDQHIDFLRELILDAGLRVIEIPPCPAGFDFMVCLTHDVDFAHIRDHGFDHSVRGFIGRATLGSLRRVMTRRMRLSGVVENWRAVLSLPLVYFGLRDDFWMQFENYRRLEGQHHSTFFLLPFKGRAGSNVPGTHPERRAAQYDVTELADEIAGMQRDGWEFGLHGIDAWHDAACALSEKNRVESVAGVHESGVRIHWLCGDDRSAAILDGAGFEYDSSCGYNETVGFRAGTSQVFKPLEASRLLEIPLHIQDVSLFYPAFLNLNDSSAWRLCTDLVGHQKQHGGVVTVLWHLRSLAPERLWGGFYQQLLKYFARQRAWFGTARQTADWFRHRRKLKLAQRIGHDGRVVIHVTGAQRDPCNPVALRIYHPRPYADTDCFPHTDREWRGQTMVATGMHEHPNAERHQAAGAAVI